jgi:hypothetical protein
MVGIKLFVVAEELQSMVDKEAADFNGSKDNRDALMSQALHGVQTSMNLVIKQIKMVTKIEEGYPLCQKQ